MIGCIYEDFIRGKTRKTKKHTCVYFGERNTLVPMRFFVEADCLSSDIPLVIRFVINCY